MKIPATYIDGVTVNTSSKKSAVVVRLVGIAVVIVAMQCVVGCERNKFPLGRIGPENDKNWEVQESDKFVIDKNVPPKGK